MPSRIWLDATDPEGTRVLRKESAIPPVPALPHGIQGNPPTIPPRHSGPVDNTQRNSLQSKSTRRKLRKKSLEKPPEVISDLIDSLTNITFPDPTEHENGHVSDHSPVVLEESLRHVRSFDALNGYRNSDKTLTEEDDVQAADFPTIKTGTTSRDYAPHKWENALGISALGHNLSSQSLASIGSTENLHALAVRKRGKTASNIRDSPKNKSPATKSAAFRRDASDSTASSKRDGKKPAKPSSLTSSPLIEGPSVPDRRSSRQIFSLTPKSNRSVTNSPAVEASSKFQVDSKPEPKTFIDFDLPSDEDTEVTKRIKELKARKEQRDREASLAPEVQLDAYGLPTTMSRPVSRDGLKSIRRVKPADLKLASSTHAMGSPNQRSASPLTPTNLPINYSHVVNSLENRPLSQAGSTRVIENPLPPPQPRPATSHGKSFTKSFFGTKRDTSASSLSRKKLITKDRKSLEVQNPEQPLPKTRDGRTNSIHSMRKRWSVSTEGPNGVERHSSVKGSNGQIRFGFNSINVGEDMAIREDVENAVEKFLASPRLSQKIKDPDSGRIISFSEVGSRKGNVVFCYVGMGITRYATAFYDELASTLNLRIITPDRPGVGGSDSNSNGNPLTWPDDILLICSKLNISKFSILAHSAGAIYALATALRIPQHIRGKVHLLAPWIPPSQMQSVGLNPDFAAHLPRSQRFLRALPATFLRVANSSFLSATSASLGPHLGNNTPKKKRKGDNQRSVSDTIPPPKPSSTSNQRPESIMLMDQQSIPDGSSLNLARSPTNDPFPPSPTASAFNKNGTANMAHQRSISSAPVMTPMSPSFPPLPSLSSPSARKLYDEALTAAIWDAATTNANPVVDLLVCLERTHNIGFRYVDITRSVVIHHGSKDTRVPVENVKWLGNSMKRCEVRILEGEGHGLMSSATLMGSVLTEMAKEWEDWTGLVSKGKVVG